MPMNFMGVGAPSNKPEEEEEERTVETVNNRPELVRTPEEVSALPPDVLQGAFSRLAASGAQAPPPGKMWEQFVPVYGQLRQMQRSAQRQRRMTGVADASNDLFDELLSRGLDVDQARAITLLQTSRRLDNLGFREESAAMRTAGADALKAWRDGVINRNQKLAETDNTISQTIERDEELEASTETWVKYKRDGSGQLEDWTQVFITDDKQMRELASKGWIAIGGNLASAMAGKLDFKTISAIPPTTQEAMISGFNMLNHLKILRSVAGDVGFTGIIPEGPIRSLAGSLGITAFNNQNFIDAAASRRSIRANIQALIKGIPSNYDASVFEAMIPDPGAWRGKEWYDAQLDVVERETKNLLSLTIAFHKGTKQPMPVEVISYAQAFGINVDDIGAMSADEVAKVRNNAEGNLFQRHEQSLRQSTANVTTLDAATQSLNDKIDAALSPQPQ